MIVGERSLTDAAWMIPVPAVLNVSREDAQESTGYSLETAAQLPETEYTGYMASLEVFHQLHCLVSSIVRDGIGERII
jgi:hypothetical protein